MVARQVPAYFHPWHFSFYPFSQSITQTGLLMATDNSPHTAIVKVTYEIHEQLKTGEFSGTPKKVGKQLISIQGISLDDATKKTNELLESMKNDNR